MQKLIVNVAAVFLLPIALLIGCQEDNLNPDLSQEDLILAIEQASNRFEIGLDELPTTIAHQVQSDFPDQYPTSILKAPQFGYKVELTSSSGSTKNYYTLEGTQIESRSVQGERPPTARCFEVLFPVEMTMPDGTIVKLTSKEDMSLVKAWHEANPDVEERGQFTFPISVQLGDSTIAIESEESFKAIRESCRPEKCFEFVFPVSFFLPNGETLTIESSEDMRQLRDWKRENPDVEGRPEPVVPLTVIQSGGELTINTLDEFEALREACPKQGKRKGGRKNSRRR